MIGRVVALAVALAALPEAHADAAKDRAALTAFEAAYQPTARLSGAARTNQACQDAAKLTAARTFSSDTAPAGAAVDGDTWSSAAHALGRALDDLTEVCKRADRKLPLLGTQVITADEVVQQLDDDVRAVVEAGKPRALSPAMKKAQAAIAAIRASSKSLCSQLPKLSRALGEAAAPPSGVAAAAWKEPHRTVKNIADDLRQSACGKHRAADEQIGSALMELHDDFYKLVLLVPPR